MNAILAIILQALSAQAIPAPEIEYVPVGQTAYAQDCLMHAAANGVVLYCQKENKILLMATTTADFL